MKMYLLQVFFLFSALFQVGGIASISPFIAVISNPSIVETNSILASLYLAMGATNLEEFLVYFAVLIAGVILLSNLIASYSLWLLFKFAVSVGSELQSRLYSSYLSNEYTFFTMNNSATLIANLTQQIPRFVYMVLQPVLQLISQAFIVVIIIIGLLIVDPVLAMCSFLVIGGVYSAIYWTVRKRVVSAGDTITNINKIKLLLLNESIAGVKEVKLLGIEQWYIKEFKEAAERGLKASAYIGLAGDLPKFIVETTVFIAILVLAVYLFTFYGTDGQAMSILSFYAMAGYKILPAAQTIYKSTSSLKANGQVIGILHRELSNAEKHRSEPGALSIPLSNKAVFTSLKIQLDCIDYRFPGKDTYALKKLSLIIPEYGFVSFVGASGAGKSTAVDILLGLLTPVNGKLIVGDVEINKGNVSEWQSNLGFVPQHIFLLDDSIKKNIAFGSPVGDIDLERVKMAARRAHISEFVEQLPLGYDTMVGERGGQLSGGQRQRIGIARALYQEPSVLIFDEATSALDTVTEKNILNELTQLARSTTIIMIAHRLSTVINSDSIYVFDKGEIVGQGSYDELSKENEYFRLLMSANASEPEALNRDKYST